MADTEIQNGVKLFDISGESPEKVTVAPEDVQSAITSGKYSFPKGNVKAIDSDGQPVTLPAEQAPQAFQGGYSYATPHIQNQIKYGSGEEQAKTALEGIAQGVAGPLAPLAEKKLFGVDPEAIRARAEANPWTHGLGEAAGLVGGALTGTGEGALLELAGKGATRLAGLGAEGAGIASKIGAHAISGATEMAILQTGDETSRMILNDPNTSFQSAIANVGLSSLLGAGGGAVFGSVAPLWKATIGDKASQFISDMRGRVIERMANPDPLAATTEELSNYYHNTKNVADDVYGTTGLKAQDIAKAIPEKSDLMTAQATQVWNMLGDAVKEMESKPNIYPARLASKLRNDFDQFSKAVSNQEDPAAIFNGIQDLKQTLQGYSKYDKFVKPVDEAYDFVKKAKDMAYNTRQALENPMVWGKAAERQLEINKAFKEYLPTLEDFERKFTSEVSGERVVDPAKVNTYLNQLGKPNAELKQEMLDNFVKASEKYRKVISDTHTNLGIENPFQHSSLNYVSKTLEKLTPGAKAADVLVNKGLAKLGGKGLGSIVGAGAGAAIGHPGIGALVGEHALGPFFESVLPSIVKPLMDKSANAEGFKAAVDYANAIRKGDLAVQRATKAVLKSGAQVSTNKVAMDDKKLDKLSDKVKEYAQNPEGLMDVGGHASYYLPHHAQAIGETAGRVVQYLDTIRPKEQKALPLDQDMKPSKPIEVQYRKALAIAEDPISVLQSVKDATITPQDMIHLKSMYPNLYTKMATQIHHEIIEKTSKEENIPYQSRLSLSLFLGEPLDSTMSMQGIQSAQATFMQSPTPQQAQGKPKGKHSMNGLNKLAEQYQTPQQARTKDKSTV